MHIPPAENSLDRRYMLELANETIKRALEIYQPAEIMLCFNGGKDCTVLLDLLAKLSTPSLQAVYVKRADTFEELGNFVENCAERYQLQIKSYESALKVAIKQALGEHPHNDEDFPLLEWSYHDIWNYIRDQKLGYCCLYDQGYTNLNPSLLYYDKEHGKQIYRAAYELQNIRDENGQA
ncbi:blast:FAD synthase [Drosophila guanche]|uniref:FAD synthase n=1 Tax=Drosophila guanche TaxID=7266 RepID=A0A3B0KHE8_DROGU|nr:blast:FAD synthase [Drosophila guanche]